MKTSSWCASSKQNFFNAKAIIYLITVCYVSLYTLMLPSKRLWLTCIQTVTHLKLHDDIVEFVVSPTANKLTNMVFPWKGKRRERRLINTFLMYHNFNETNIVLLN